MTFNAHEISIEDGQPIELYSFSCDTLSWFFTSTAEDIIIDSQLYTALPIERSQLEATNTEERTAIKVTVARDNGVADIFRVAPPSSMVIMTIKRVHYSDGDEEVRLLWTGRVINADWRGATVVLNCEPASISFNRNGLRRLYQRQCPHVLYGPACGISSASFQTPASVTALSGLSVTVPEADALVDDYLSGGTLVWVTTDGVTERRMIKTHTGPVVTITHGIPDFEVGADVTLIAGCDHTLATCRDKFANKLNYGGFPYIPQKNPFGGSPIY